MKTIVNVNVAGSFDYSTLAIYDQSRLRAAALNVAFGVSRALDAQLQIGRALFEIKDILPHGEFIRWVELECKLNVRTAQKSMAAFSVVERYPSLSKYSLKIIQRVATCSRRIDPTLLERHLQCDPAPSAHELLEFLSAGGNGRNGNGTVAGAPPDENAHRWTAWQGDAGDLALMETVANQLGDTLLPFLNMLERLGAATLTAALRDVWDRSNTTPSRI
ncbi:MAG: DUF3102 domain-containing protein [Devosia sp.]